MVGSVNFDARSLVLNEQVALVIDDRSTAASLDRDFEQDLAHSEQTHPEHWMWHGRPRRLVEAVAHAVDRPARGMGAAGMTGPMPSVGRRGRFRDGDSI